MAKDNIEQKKHLIDLMNMENKEAMALVDKYISIGCLFANATKCAKLDLTNRIEMLEDILKEHVNTNIDGYFIYLKIFSLKQQLKYLNTQS
jgi:hypothetical protein